MAKLVESFKVATTLLAQRIVGPATATANTVEYPDAVASSMIGITIDTVLDTSSGIPVQTNSIAKLYFNDSCASGERVTADTSGRGVAFSAVTAATSYIGFLVDAKVEDTATVANVFIQPGQASSE